MSQLRLTCTKQRICPNFIMIVVLGLFFVAGVKVAGAEVNGLYTNCYTFGQDCKILRGGQWTPGVKGTVTEDSVAYKYFTQAGWKWGGQLKGRQKDFMDFSLTGD